MPRPRTNQAPRPHGIWRAVFVSLVFTRATLLGPPALAAPPPALASNTLAPCATKPPAPGPYRPPFGESLGYDIEVMGVRAGHLEMRYVPDTLETARIEVRTRSNTFFENVRRLKAEVSSTLGRESLRPQRYREDAVEDGVKKWAEVRFRADRQEAEIRYPSGKTERRFHAPMTTGPHDLLSVILTLRTLPLALHQPFCLDVYGNRRVWRVRGTVSAEEWVSTPAGKFKAWRLSGRAQRVDLPKRSKVLHLWIAQDAHHTPLAVLSEIDLGPVSATLSSVRRPGESPQRKTNHGGGTW